LFLLFLNFQAVILVHVTVAITIMAQLLLVHVVVHHVNQLVTILTVHHTRTRLHPG